MEWFSAQSLARLPGMPATESGVIRKARDKGWQWQKRAGRGGGREYHISALPNETQDALRHQTAIAKQQRRATAEDERAHNDHLNDLQHAGEALGAAVAEEQADQSAERQRRRQQGAADFAAMAPSAKKDRMRTRFWLLRSAMEYVRDGGFAKISGINAFCDALASGEIPLPAAHEPHINRLHGRVHLNRATILKWESAYNERGMMGLADARGCREKRSKIDQNDALRRVVLGALIKYPHITGKKIKAYLEAGHPELNIVSQRGIERYINAWKSDNHQLWTYIVNPDQWKSVYMSAMGSHFERIERLNQVWELDSTPGDWLLKDGRHSVLGCIDLYSRRLKLLVSKTSKASAVCQVMRRAIIDWGICEAARTDNGKDYVSDQLEEVLSALEIIHEICIPFASEDKGTIERALGTMSHGILDLLPGFIGHNVAERKIIEARKSFAQRIMTKGEAVEVELTSDELQERLDQWVDAIYSHDPHSGLDGKTPWQVAHEWAAPVRRVYDERALDALLAEVADTRTITKKGIRFENYKFIHPILPQHAGKEVHLKRDEHELGSLYVYLEGAFLCIAKCPELEDISRQEWAVAAKRGQKKKLAEQAEEFRRYKRELKRDIPAAVLEHRVSEYDKLAALPQREERYTTEGLEQAGKAAAARHDKATQQLSEAQQADRQRLVEEMRQPATVTPIRDDSRTKMRRWLTLEDKLKRGEGITDEDHSFWKGFQATSEWRAEMALIEDFGREALGMPMA